MCVGVGLQVSTGSLTNIKQGLLVSRGSTLGANGLSVSKSKTSGEAGYGRISGVPDSCSQGCRAWGLIRDLPHVPMSLQWQDHGGLTIRGTQGVLASCVCVVIWTSSRMGAVGPVGSYGHVPETGEAGVQGQLPGSLHA